jgi:hypothetical protein
MRGYPNARSATLLGYGICNLSMLLQLCNPLAIITDDMWNGNDAQPVCWAQKQHMAMLAVKGPGKGQQCGRTR